MVVCTCYVHPLCTLIWNVLHSICYVFGYEPYNCSMNVVSKRSYMAARSLKRSCRMNMVSKRSCMVTGFLKRSCRWLWFQNGHAWWLGFEMVMQHGTRVSERSCTMARVLKRSSRSTKGFSFSLRLVSVALLFCARHSFRSNPPINSLQGIAVF